MQCRGEIERSRVLVPFPLRFQCCWPGALSRDYGALACVYFFGAAAGAVVLGAAAVAVPPDGGAFVVADFCTGCPVSARARSTDARSASAGTAPSSFSPLTNIVGVEFTPSS